MMLQAIMAFKLFVTNFTYHKNLALLSWFIRIIHSSWQSMHFYIIWKYPSPDFFWPVFENVCLWKIEILCVSVENSCKKIDLADPKVELYLWVSEYPSIFIKSFKYRRIAKTPRPLLYLEFEYNSRKIAKNILCYLVKLEYNSRKFDWEFNTTSELFSWFYGIVR